MNDEKKDEYEKEKVKNDDKESKMIKLLKRNKKMIKTEMQSKKKKKENFQKILMKKHQGQSLELLEENLKEIHRKSRDFSMVNTPKYLIILTFHQEKARKFSEWSHECHLVTLWKKKQLRIETRTSFQCSVSQSTCLKVKVTGMGLKKMGRGSSN